MPDRERLVPLVDIPASLVARPLRAKGDLTAPTGNHVLIAFEGLVALVAHLRRGSVAVAGGERVSEGQELGVLGISGNSLAPHLHFHIMDGTDFARAKVVPFRVRAFEHRVQGRWVAARDEHLQGRLLRIRVGEHADAIASSVAG